MADLQSASLGDDLAILTLRVAAQVDRKLRGIQIDRSPFVDFRSQLAKATAEPCAGTASYLQINPAATEVLAKAFHETQRNISNITELTNALTDIIETIEKFNIGDPSPEDLSKMKSFCLSLHRSMMSQKLPPPFEAENAFEDRLGILR